MVTSAAATVEAYLAEVDDDRRDTVAAVRQHILDHLPDGYEETMRWGMISYEIPLERYPDTYNGQPLGYVGLAAQKRHLALYLMGVYTAPDGETAFRDRWEATGKELDMGRSCVRFRRLDDLPLELLGDTIAATGVDDYIATYEASRGR